MVWKFMHCRTRRPGNAGGWVAAIAGLMLAGCTSAGPKPSPDTPGATASPHHPAWPLPSDEHQNRAAAEADSDPGSAKAELRPAPQVAGPQAAGAGAERVEAAGAGAIAAGGPLARYEYEHLIVYAPDQVLADEAAAETRDLLAALRSAQPGRSAPRCALVVFSHTSPLPFTLPELQGVMTNSAGKSAGAEAPRSGEDAEDDLLQKLNVWLKLRNLGPDVGIPPEFVDRVFFGISMLPLPLELLEAWGLAVSGDESPVVLPYAPGSEVRALLSTAKELLARHSLLNRLLFAFHPMSRTSFWITLRDQLLGEHWTLVHSSAAAVH